ncbi:MAG: hypothetical protein QOK26_1524 [Pseudonocardiales bacterium]|nr:hypothetical protein [Pseudonocardiales bacterium]
MQVDWHGELIGQMEFYRDTSLRPRLDGLTDAEYLWEPAPERWSVRPQHPDGAATVGWAYPEPGPPPLTTIAWRPPGCNSVSSLIVSARGQDDLPLMCSTTFANSRDGEKSTYSQSSSASGACPGAQ